MRVRILTLAPKGLDAAVAYYNDERAGQGYRFLAEALGTIDRIKQFPEAWQPFSRGTRRCQVRRFPYGVVYRKEDSLILIVAVAHLHREPDYWVERTSP